MIDSVIDMVDQHGPGSKRSKHILVIRQPSVKLLPLKEGLLKHVTLFRGDFLLILPKF